jgi:hypothetical protein
MPLAECRGAVPVLRQDPRQGRAIAGNRGRVAGEAARELTDGAEADRMVVPPGEQGRARRGTQRGDVEPVVAQPRLGHLRVAGGVDRPAERARVAEAGVVDEHQQDVRRSWRGFGVPDQVPVGLRSVQRPVAHPLERQPANRKIRSVGLAHCLPTSSSKPSVPGSVRALSLPVSSLTNWSPWG